MASQPSGSVGLDTVARQLLRSEAVASSKIEGLVLSHRPLAKAAAVRSGDLTAQSVLANVAATEAAYEFARSGEAFSVDALRRIHARLFESTPQERWGGVVRDRQNWIGGDATTPVTMTSCLRSA